MTDAEAREALAVALVAVMPPGEVDDDDDEGWMAEADRLLAALAERGMTIAPTSQAEAGAALERLEAEAASLGCSWTVGRNSEREGREHYADLTLGSYTPGESIVDAIGRCIEHTRAAALGDG